MVNQFQPPQYGENTVYPNSTDALNDPNPKIVPTSQQKPNDLWAAALFIANFAATVVLCVMYVPDYIRLQNGNKNSSNGSMTAKEQDQNKALIYSIGVSAAVAIVASCMYMALMAKFPKVLIKFTLYLSIAFAFAGAALMLATGQYITGVIMAVFAVLYTFCALSWRSRIPFATVMLETVVSIVKAFPATLTFGFMGLIVDVAFFIFWALTLSASVNHFSGDDQQGKQSGVVIYLIFSFYWTSEVLKNIVHVTISGVFATYYFLAGTPQMVRNPTAAAAGRALGKSFGSICFGSLVVALIKTMRAICRQLRSSGGDGAAQFLACIAECLLGIIEGLIVYFNHYAYTQVAIYGKDYITAAKDTWRMIKSRGIDAIINDNLIGNVLVMGSLLVGVVTAVIAYLFVRSQVGGTDASTYGMIAAGIGFLLGTFINSVFTEVISSGVSTTFVCLAEDPMALARSKPLLHQKIQQVYPGVLSNV